MTDIVDEYLHEWSRTRPGEPVSIVKARASLAVKDVKVSIDG